MLSSIMPDIKTEVFEHTDATGATFIVERMEVVMPVDDIPSEEINVGCQACHNYGKNYACPPHSPYIKDYTRQFSKARVICLRVPLEQFTGISAEERWDKAYALVRAMVYEELMAHRKAGSTVAGSGPCEVCKECVVLKGKGECVMPHKRIYSLEAMGVSVVLLTERAFDINLEWSAGGDNAADFVSAIGAVFE